MSKTYWLAQFEKAAMENMHQRRIEITKEIKSIMTKWSKKVSKPNIREMKKLITQAKKNHGVFSKIMRALTEDGASLMNIYLKSWHVLGYKPKMAKLSLLNIMRSSL